MTHCSKLGAVVELAYPELLTRTPVAPSKPTGTRYTVVECEGLVLTTVAVYAGLAGREQLLFQQPNSASVSRAQALLAL